MLLTRCRAVPCCDAECKGFNTEGWIKYWAPTSGPTGAFAMASSCSGIYLQDAAGKPARHAACMMHNVAESCRTE